MMDAVDIILGTGLPKNVKIIRLVAVTQLNYREPIGDKAWDSLRNITDNDTMLAIAYLVGFCGSPGEEAWNKLLERGVA